MNAFNSTTKFKTSPPWAVAGISTTETLKGNINQAHEPTEKIY
jgi:hypothetical protein